MINNNKKFVLSTGGGTPCFYDNINVINESGVSIYLKYSAGILTSRLINTKKNRPLINGLDKVELHSFITKKIREREVYYNKSSFVISENNLKIDDIIKLFE